MNTSKNNKIGNLKPLGHSKEDPSFAAFPLDDWPKPLSGRPPAKRFAGGVFLITHRTELENGDGLHRLLYVGGTDRLFSSLESLPRFHVWHGTEANTLAFCDAPAKAMRTRLIDRLVTQFDPPCNRSRRRQRQRAGCQAPYRHETIWQPGQVLYAPELVLQQFQADEP